MKGDQAPDYEERFRRAVRGYWTMRDQQAADQASRGVVDAGTRGAVTGGRHLNLVAALVREVFADAGLASAAAGRDILPGYYRGSKNWDLVIPYRGSIVAIIELKSQVGSFGKNQNNRIEEMVGQSLDVWRAARENLLGSIRPWFGYLMLLEDHADSRAPRGTPTNAGFAPDPAFHQASYLDRYRIAFERLRLEGDLSAVCLACSDHATASVEYIDQTMSFNAFAAAIHARVIEIFGMLGPPDDDLGPKQS